MERSGKIPGIRVLLKEGGLFLETIDPLDPGRCGLLQSRPLRDHGADSSQTELSVINQPSGHIGSHSYQKAAVLEFSLSFPLQDILICRLERIVGSDRLPIDIRWRFRGSSRLVGNELPPRHEVLDGTRPQGLTLRLRLTLRLGICSVPQRGDFIGS